MRERLREAERRIAALGGRPVQGRRDRPHARVPELGDAVARGGPARRSHLTQRLARARAILIAWAIGMAAFLALASPAPARATAAPAPPPTTCVNQVLLHGSYGDVTVTPGHWCAIGFSTVRGNIDVTGARFFFLFASGVAGNVTITGTTSNPDAAIGHFGPASAICSSAIHGNLTISDSGPEAPWNISSTNYTAFFTDSNCLAQDYVRGNVTFTNNAGSPNEIGGADIDGNLECHGNGSFTRGILIPFQMNGVNGTTSGQCTRFAVSGDNPYIFPGPPPWLHSVAARQTLALAAAGNFTGPRTSARPGAGRRFLVGPREKSERATPRRAAPRAARAVTARRRGSPAARHRTQHCGARRRASAHLRATPDPPSDRAGRRALISSTPLEISSSPRASSSAAITSATPPSKPSSGTQASCRSIHLLSSGQ